MGRLTILGYASFYISDSKLQMNWVTKLSWLHQKQTYTFDYEVEALIVDDISLFFHMWTFQAPLEEKPTD